jgi:hypothetical protein
MSGPTAPCRDESHAPGAPGAFGLAGRPIIRTVISSQYKQIRFHLPKNPRRAAGWLHRPHPMFLGTHIDVPHGNPR